MTTAETLADRRAHLHAGLTELACDRCAARVLVKKHSAAHTSIQWTAVAVAACTEFAATAAAGRPTALVATCASLRASIERAVAEGRLAVARP